MGARNSPRAVALGDMLKASVRICENGCVFAEGLAEKLGSCGVSVFLVSEEITSIYIVSSPSDMVNHQVKSVELAKMRTARHGHLLRTLIEYHIARLINLENCATIGLRMDCSIEDECRAHQAVVRISSHQHGSHSCRGADFMEASSWRRRLPRELPGGTVGTIAEHQFSVDAPHIFLCFTQAFVPHLIGCPSLGPESTSSHGVSDLICIISYETNMFAPFQDGWTTEYDVL